MKIRFNELTLSRPPAQCYMELCEFRHVALTVVDKLGCRKWIFAKGESAAGCTLFDVWNYVVSNRELLRTSLSQREFVILTNFALTFRPHLTHSQSTYSSEELGCACQADMESEATDAGMLSVGFDYPRNRSVMQILKATNGSGSTHEKESVCVTRLEHFTDDVVKRVLYCNSATPNAFSDGDKGFESDDRGGKHFVIKGSSQGSPADWKREPWFEETSERLKAKFKPGITFEGRAYSEYERRALHAAMRAGHYSESAIDAFEADLNEVVGISRKQPTSCVHVCLSSRRLHLYPCN